MGKRTEGKVGYGELGSEFGRLTSWSGGNIYESDW